MFVFALFLPESYAWLSLPSRQLAVAVFAVTYAKALVIPRLHAVELT